MKPTASKSKDKPTKLSKTTVGRFSRNYRRKPSSDTSQQHLRTVAGILARLFGVSAKTIRDVWVGRTWYRATFHMDHAKPFAPERLEKKAGRPKGSKDRKSRSCFATLSGGSHNKHLLGTNNQVGNKSCTKGRYGSLRHRACRVSAGSLRHAPSHAYPVKDAFSRGNADSRSWANFPKIISSSCGFEDPFREDWELALQCNELESRDGDWIG